MPNIGQFTERVARPNTREMTKPYVKIVIAVVIGATTVSDDFLPVKSKIVMVLIHNTPHYDRTRPMMTQSVIILNYP